MSASYIKSLFFLLFFCCPVLFASSYGYAVANEDGFGFISNDNQNRLFLHGLLQFDQDAFFDTRGLTINHGTAGTPIINEDTVDRFWLRRARPIFNGTLWEYNDFFFNPDFGLGQTRVFDAIIDLHYFEQFSFRIGKQKSLLGGFDRLRSASTNNTVERGYASMMSPNRQYGFILYGTLGPQRETPYILSDYKYIRFNNFIAYDVGLLTGTFDNANPGLNPASPTTFSTETATLDNKAIEARLFTNLFLNSCSPLRNLGLGIAGSTENVINQTNPPAMLSIGQNPIFFYQPTVNGNGPRNRIHPMGFWFLGPFGVFGEWAQTNQNLTDGLEFPNAHVKAIELTNRAAEVQVFYNLTQEPFTFGHLSPYRKVTPNLTENYGAFQLMARWTRLMMDTKIFNYFNAVGGQTIYNFADPRLSVQSANTWAIGINWFLNKNVVIMTEYDQTYFVGGCSTGGLNAPITPGCLTAGAYATASTSQVLNRPNEKVIMQRFQLSF